MKSIITDTLCHIYWHLILTPIHSIKSWYYKYKLNRYCAHYQKACDRARNKLQFIRSNEKYIAEYEKKTGKSAMNRHGALSAYYKEWLEENKGE